MAVILTSSNSRAQRYMQRWKNPKKRKQYEDLMKQRKKIRKKLEEYRRQRRKRGEVWYA